MQGLQRHFPSTLVRLAYLGSNSCCCAVSEDAYRSVPVNRGAAPWPIRLTGCPAPETSSVADDSSTSVKLVHPWLETQGPNYALAKTLQWGGTGRVVSSSRAVSKHNSCPNVVTSRGPDPGQQFHTRV